MILAVSRGQVFFFYIGYDRFVFSKSFFSGGTCLELRNLINLWKKWCSPLS